MHEQIPQPDQSDYDTGHSWLKRKLFIHTVQELNQLNEIVQDKTQLEVNDLKNIKEDDKVQKTGENVMAELNSIRDRQEKDDVSLEDLIGVVYNQTKSQLWLTYVLYLVDTLLEIGLFYILETLLQDIRDYQEGSPKGILYLKVVIITLLWVISIIFGHNAEFQCFVFVNKIRNAVKLVIYEKVLREGKRAFRQNQRGKIINVLTQFHEFIEEQLDQIIHFASSPPLIIFSVWAIIRNIGWAGLVLVFLPPLLLIGQYFYAQWNSQHQEKKYQISDQKMAILEEIIESIRYIKMHVWQKFFKRRIDRLRQKQKFRNIEYGKGQAVMHLLGGGLFDLILIGSFIISIASGHLLTTKQIFFVVALSEMLMETYEIGADGLMGFFRIKIQLRRLVDILNIKARRMIKIDFEVQQPDDKKKKKKKEKEGLQNGEVKFQDFTAYYNKKCNDEILDAINLHIKRGQFIGITGKVGSGKSTLMNAILGHISYYEGHLQVKGRVAFVEQQPFIFTSTVRQNVVLGRQWDQGRYQQAISDSCLVEDLYLFPNRDQTELGQRGVTISGGQKARLALARALYTKNVDVYIFDDIISAVDAKVAKKILSNLQRNIIKQKTVILITHHVHFLSKCNRTVIMKGCTIQKVYKENMFRHFLKFYKKEREVSDSQEQEEVSSDSESIDSSQYSEEEIMDILDVGRDSEIQIKGKDDQETLSQNSDQGDILRQKKQEHFEIVERKKKGHKESSFLKTFSSFIFYSKSNYCAFGFTLFLFLMAHALYVVILRILANYDIYKCLWNHGDNRILHFCQDHNILQDFTKKQSHIIFFNTQKQMWMVCLLICLLIIIIDYIMVVLMVHSIQDANLEIHKQLVRATLNVPVSFYDTTHSSQVINYFSLHMEALDQDLPDVIEQFLDGFCAMLVLGLSFAIFNWLFFPFLILDFAFKFWIIMKYKHIVLYCTDLDYKYSEYVLGHFSQTLRGFDQIQVYTSKRYFYNKMIRLLDDCSRISLAYARIFQGMVMTLDYISAATTLLGLLLVIFSLTTANHGLMIALITILIQFTEQFVDIVDSGVWMQTSLVSYVNLLEFLHMERQNYTGVNQQQSDQLLATIDDSKITKSIQFQDLSLKYKTQKLYALDHINLTIQNGERMGIIGRTGAGKSSMIQALFRMVQPEEGSIYNYFGTDAKALNTKSLRKSMTIIPQNPFIFTDTLKRNLDPYQQHRQEELIDVLQKVDLWKKISKLKHGLNSIWQEHWKIFSVGQKQLFCLARALINKQKVLVLDEATSQVDNRTDSLMQQIIRKEFATSTIIAIAHRLTTIADYDRVIVVSDAKIVEGDSPSNLLRAKGAFYTFVEESGTSFDDIVEIAEEAEKTRNIRRKQE